MSRLWFVLLVLVAATAQGAAPDDEFLAAREAYRSGNAARLDRHAARLKGHLLEPYVLYWQLSRRLELTPVEDVRAFLAANRDSPLSEQLRNEWLKSLGRRGAWELFNAELPLLVGDNLEITCYSLQSRLRVNAAETLPEVRPLWFVARDLPESCTPLFEALVAAGMLSSDDLWTRLRLALEVGQVGLARSIARWLPAGQAPEPRVLEVIASNPAGYLDRQQAPNLKNRAARESVLFAVHRLARTAPHLAARHWTRLEERFSPEERAYAWGMIGHFGAMRHHPDALAWYARAGDLSDLQLAWKSRAALRDRNWQEVLAAIGAMTGLESSQPAWRYWKARALTELGRAEEAAELLKPLASEFNFYGQLALEELGGKITVPEAYKPREEEVRAMAAHTGLRRAIALYRLNLRVEANREWLWAIRGFDDKQLLAASEVALRHEIYDRAINTADRTIALHDFHLRYLAPYRDVLNVHTSQLELDEAWVYGLIRQESRFNPGVRSRAGASGLMQLMPGTAKWVAGKLGLKDWRWSNVTQVDTNVSLGTYYLRHVLDTLDGHPVLASAAYNAGPGRARAWRPEFAIEGAVYAESIPFNETRDYVKRVMANASYYAHNFSQPMLPLKQRMGTIGPRLPAKEIPLGDTP
jgi:soluble lytic murein transglycosylase